MKTGKLLVLVLLAAVLASCGTIVTVEKPPQQGLLEASAKRVLIFPFPSYEPMTPQAWLSLNANLFEDLADSFVGRGFDPLPYETVLALLQKEKILEVKSPQVQVHPTVRMILEDPEWSPLMKEEILRTLQKERRQVVRLDLEKWAAFSDEKLLALARQKGVDFLVCGRISRWRLRPEETFNPFQIGFLTFLTRVPARLLYGAPQEGYDLWHQVASGALWGGLIGANAKDPFEPPTYRPSTDGHPLFSSALEKVSGDSHYETWNTVVWGLMGAGLGFLAAHGGEAPEAVLTLSLAIYDVQAGHKIWSSRVKLKVTPESVFAPHQGEKLFEKALSTAVSQLMARFWQDYQGPQLALATP